MLRHAFTLTIFLMATVAASLVWPTTEAIAQEKPSDEDLASIVEQLSSRHREGSTVEFLNVDAATSSSCKMNAASMKVSRGADSKSFPVLINNTRDPSRVSQLFAKLGRISVDADGAGRAYHPDDPFTDPTCGHQPNQPLPQACALDNFSDGGMRLFQGAVRLKRPDPKSPPADEPEFLPNWRALWPLIRDEKLVPLSLAAIAGLEGPRQYNLIHWPERNLTFAFNTKIIPATKKGFPCRYGQDSEYSGYFISATTFKKRSPTRADGCKPKQYLDSEKIPFFVVPAPKFSRIELGDIAIGFLRTPTELRIAYGIAGDSGPYDHFGEGSIAFNKALLDQSGPIESAKEVDRLDIDLAEPDGRLGAGASLAVLVLGGTKSLLSGDYSAANIKKIGEAQLRRWRADGSGGRRLDACFDDAH
jgi:Fungal chitosanase of glycosyl hydrolase group 75